MSVTPQRFKLGKEREPKQRKGARVPAAGFPVNPIVGDEFYHAVQKTWYIWDGTSWTVYVKVQPNGITQPTIINAGTAVVNTDASGNATVPYTTAFPTATDMVVVNEGQGLDRIATWTFGSSTAAGFTVNVRVASTGAPQSGAHRIDYIALGH